MASTFNYIPLITYYQEFNYIMNSCYSKQEEVTMAYFDNEYLVWLFCASPKEK